MAVQKSKKSRSKRNSKRNTTHVFKLPSLTLDKVSNEVHLRHFVSKSGFYKGRKILDDKKKEKVLKK